MFIVLAYNLEWFGGRFHTTFWLAVSWGVFPVLTSYWTNALELRASALLAAGGCAMLLVAQRTSQYARARAAPAHRFAHRRTEARGRVIVPLDAARLAAPMERALQACAVGMVLLATGLVAARL